MSNHINKIAILDDYQNAALALADWSLLQERAEITVFNDTISDPDEIVARLQPFNIVCVMRERTKFTRGVLSRLKNLELLASTAVKNAAIDMHAASELGIAVAWTEALPYGTPELTWALILAAMRKLPREHHSFRTGGWQTSVGSDIHGRVLGVVGLGNVGKAVARVGAAFGMRVIAWSPNLSVEAAAKEGVLAVSKDELFQTSDIITIHMVLSERSLGVIGADDLTLMKPTAWLINTSRGQLVDEASLVTALVQEQIGGAALDTYHLEPLEPDHVFRTLSNVIGTPHIGFVTEDTFRLFYGQTVENVTAWLDRVPLRTEMPNPNRTSQSRSNAK